MKTVERRDLRDGVSPWEADLLPASTPPLTKDLRCDVLIVGGGVSGALLAEALSAQSLSVALVDRRAIAHGSTAASTAMVEFELDTPLLDLQKQIGEMRAAAVYRRSLRAVSGLMQKIQILGIDCEQAPHQTVYLCGKKLSAERMLEEVEARQRIALPSKYLSAEELRSEYGLSRPAAILSSGSAQLNPVKLTNGLIEVSRRRGVQIFEKTDIVDFSQSSQSVLAKTESGHTIEARYLVFATGYELPDQVPRSGHKVISTWAIATRPQAKLWPGEVMITEADEPYLYVRVDAERRVIAGGEDEQSGDSDTRKQEFSSKIATIQSKLKDMLPFLDVKSDFAWTGAFGVSDTGLPSIGKIPGYQRCYALLGFGGNGTTFSMIGADLISADIRGTPDADAKLFAFEEFATTPP